MGFFNRGLNDGVLLARRQHTFDERRVADARNRARQHWAQSLDEHCLSGEPMMIFETSDGVVGQKTSRAGVVRG